MCICPGDPQTGLFDICEKCKKNTNVLGQVPKCSRVPYQKCEEGYEDKCKETPKKVNLWNHILIEEMA